MLIALLSIFQLKATEFITRWNLGYPGSGANTLIFGMSSTGPVNYSWETIPASSSGSGTLNGPLAIVSGLPSNALIRLKIDTPHFKSFRLDTLNGDQQRLIDIEQWGTVRWNSMENAFKGARNLNISATDIPDLSQVKSMSKMFMTCSALNGSVNINTWNTSQVKDMSFLFAYDSLFNQPIGNWNTSGVWNMSNMFQFAYTFNQPIGNWNTSQVETFYEMFSYALAFNQDIGNWNLAKAQTLSRMFNGAASFNKNISNWNTAKVVYMDFMFAGAKVFNQALNTWKTDKVVDMGGMFSKTDSFNQALSNWNTRQVKNMFGMFEDARVFNQNISSWKTDLVENFGYMFRNAKAFNQPIHNWKTPAAERMDRMFEGAIQFNQPIGRWNTSKVWTLSKMFKGAKSFNQHIGLWSLESRPELDGFLDSCGMDCSHYSSLLKHWSTDTLIPGGLVFSALGLKYGNNAEGYRTYLQNIKEWHIQGDAMQASSCCLSDYMIFDIKTCPPYVFQQQAYFESGEYFSDFKNIAGCDSLIKLELELHPLDTTIQYWATTLKVNQTDAEYQWYHCEENFALPGETQQHFMPSRNGSYRVVIKKGTCMDSSACFVVNNLGLTEADFRLFPNPTRGRIKISPSDFLSDNVRLLYNAVGQLLYYTYGDYMDLSTYAKGIYYFKCGTIVVKVVLE